MTENKDNKSGRGIAIGAALGLTFGAALALPRETLLMALQSA